MPEIGKILVIDDEEGIRRGIQRVLSQEGYVIHSASDGAEGVAAIGRDSYDLLLVDLKMPGALDGLDVIKAGLEKDPDVIAVVISAYATLEAAIQATRIGAYDFMAKPFTPDDLRITVRKGLERRTLVLERKHLVAERESNLMELSAERSRLKSVVNSMADGVLVVNQHGLIVYANPVADTMLRPDEPLEGSEFRVALNAASIGPCVEQMMDDTHDGTESVTQEFDLDEKTSMMAKVTALRDRGKQMGVVVVLRDISRLKELDRMKSRFVSVVSHELKAPLAAVEGYLEVLLSGTAGEMPERSKGIIERCRDRAASLQTLIKDILNVTKLEAQSVSRRIERHGLPCLVREILDMLQPNIDQKGVTVVHRSPGGMPPVFADRDDLERLFTNLISNAVKYNRDGGTVTISYDVSDRWLRATVSDTGIGIEKEHLDHLGKDFFRVRNAETSKISGTGLGLSIVKKIMEFYHGSLQVRSEMGAGSSFTLSFPLEAAPVPAAGPVQHPI